MLSDFGTSRDMIHSSLNRSGNTGTSVIYCFFPNPMSLWVSLSHAFFQTGVYCSRISSITSNGIVTAYRFQGGYVEPGNDFAQIAFL